MIFEELEPRLLFSADGAEALAADAVVQEIEQQPVIIIEAEGSEQIEENAVDQPAETTPGEVAVFESRSENSEDLQASAADPHTETGSESEPEQPSATTADTTLFDAEATQSADEASEEANELSSTTELVFVNDNVRDVEKLVDDIKTSDGFGRSFEVITLDSTHNGLKQITETLQYHTNLDAIHFITHGSDGRIGLGNDWLDTNSLRANSDDVVLWGNSLTDKGDILFYGCNIAADSEGENLLNSIAELTGADVAASEDMTGHSDRDADWDLEYTAGTVDSKTPLSSELIDDWDNTLATYVVTNTNDSGAGSLRQAISDANATNGVNDTIVFNIAANDLRHYYYQNDFIAGSVGIIGITTEANDLNIFDIDPDFAKSWYSIQLTTSILPAITDTLIIDGTSQSGFTDSPIIELDGQLVSASDPNGITIETSDSTIRGLIINRFGDDAIEIDNQGGGNTIVGNYLGTDATGLLSGYGNQYGITVKSDGNTIGGTNTADRNVIAGNSTSGLSFGIGFWQDADNNVVQGNYIGVGADGTSALGNLQGITFQNTTDFNLIGGETLGDGNVIAFNSQNGVDIIAGTNNAIVRNSIHSNTLLGINLGSGANNDQNFPVLTSAVTNGTQITVEGTLNSTANKSFRIEVYSNVTGDPTGYGEGQTLIGILDVGTDSFGNASFSSALSASVSAGSAISATVSRLDAGDAEIETSEFAQNVIATSAANTAPELSGAGLHLTGLNEDPTVNNGDLVSAIIASAGGDPITDADAGALEGIAIFSLSNSNGTWEYDIGSGWTPVGSVSVASSLLLRDTDSLRFVPNTNWNGTELFTFAAWDQTSCTAGTKVDTSSYGGTTAFSSGTAIPSITVDGVNDAPTSIDNTVITNENNTYTFSASDFNFSDIDGDTLDSVKITNLEALGSLQLSGADVILNQVIIRTEIDAGNLKFVPVNNASGAGYDSFGFSVNDGTSDSTSSYTMTIDVNAAPTTSGIADVTVNENASNTVIDLFASFADTEDVDASLTYTITSNTNQGLFSTTPIDGSAGTLTLDYAPNTYGTASITVRATDSGGAIVESTFLVTVNSTNLAPAAVNDAYTVNEDSSLAVDWWNTAWDQRQQMTFDNSAQTET